MSAGLRCAVRAELVKVGSVRVPWICVGVAGAAMAAFAFAYGRISAIDGDAVQPIGRAPVNVLAFVQYAVVVIALQIVATEYSTGSIRSTLITVPDRVRLMTAKALVAAVVAFVLGVGLGVVGMVAAWPGFRGLAVVEAGSIVRTLLTMGLYLALIAVLTLGLGAAVRSPVGAFALALALITVLPWMLQGLGGDTLTTIAELLPQSSGGNVMLGRDTSYPVWTAVVITTAWAGASWGVGLAVVRARDA